MQAKGMGLIGSVNPHLHKTIRDSIYLGAFFTLICQQLLLQ